ncbi:YciI family protein [Parasedimentitalea psychrophila]|uniref:YciI family protein n=1 Tax=Parasedimentitalea psychrophila TaxID=2997337 RepID=A0A9Y2L2Y4_9RHOB|nr:YciI family protein [Parasedimentitalea psychrophila]WIY26706.1 YciI family protein [Parasedimentitalea psychrophila]
MAQFIFAYHGGKKPDTPEDGAKVMQAWKDWMGSMGDALIVPGAPVGMSKTVSASGIADDGGANPLAGYSVVEAASIDAASEMAKGCPMVVDGDGSVEVAEILEM